MEKTAVHGHGRRIANNADLFQASARRVRGCENCLFKIDFRL